MQWLRHLHSGSATCGISSLLPFSLLPLHSSLLFCQTWSYASAPYAAGSDKVKFGVTRYRGTSAGSDYNNPYTYLCGQMSDATACHVFRATGAFTISWALLAIVPGTILLFQGLFLGACSRKVNFHAWQARLATLQATLLVGLILLWALAGDLNVMQYFDSFNDQVGRSGDSAYSLKFGASWALAFVCMALSWPIAHFHCSTISHRRSGDVQADAAAAAVEAEATAATTKTVPVEGETEPKHATVDIHEIELQQGVIRFHIEGQEETSAPNVHDQPQSPSIAGGVPLNTSD